MEIVYVYTKLRSEFGKHTGHFEDAPARPEWTIEPNEEVRWPLWGAASFFVFATLQTSNHPNPPKTNHGFSYLLNIRHTVRQEKIDNSPPCTRCTGSPRRDWQDTHS